MEPRPPDKARYGMSVEEIAEALGMSREAVKGVLFRAMRKLRQSRKAQALFRQLRDG